MARLQRLDRPMLRDVAKKAFVGLATASRALSGRGSVAPESRKRVLRAAKSLSYRPAFAAMSLRGQRPPLIGVVSFFIEAWSQIEMLWGLDQGLWASGHHLLFSPYHSHSPSDRKRVAAWIEDASAQNLFQGLVVMSDRLLDESVLDFVLERDIPLVTLEFSHPGCRAILVDNVAGGQCAADWLGPRCPRFRVITHDSSQSLFAERLDGFSTGLKKSNPRATLIVDRCPGVSFADGLNLGNKITLKGDGPTGIFVLVGDIAALGLHQGLRARGYKPDRDYLIVGYDGLSSWRYAGKPFATVLQPLREMGASAADLMLGALSRPEQLEVPRILRPRLEEGGPGSA